MEIDDGPHHAFGNRNATKPIEDKHSAFLHVRVRKDEKLDWNVAARKKEVKLADWVRTTLNRAARRELKS